MGAKRAPANSSAGALKARVFSGPGFISRSNLFDAFQYAANSKNFSKNFFIAQLDIVYQKSYCSAAYHML